jgi:hypothetical protein
MKFRITNGSNGRASAITSFAGVGQRLRGRRANAAPVHSRLVPTAQAFRPRSRLTHALDGLNDVPVW